MGILDSAAALFTGGTSLPMLSAGLSSAAQLYQISEQERQAQTDRDFQAGMSNTAYQRAVGDLKAAGLNPMLAYERGGASTPGGAQANIGTENPVSAGISSAMQGAQIMQTAATTEQTKALTAKAKAEADNVAQDTELKKQQTSASATSSAMEYERLSRGLPRAEVGSLEASAASARQNVLTQQAQVDRTRAEVDNLVAELKNIPKTGRLIDQQARVQRVIEQLEQTRERHENELTALAKIDADRAKREYDRTDNIYHDMGAQLSPLEGWLKSVLGGAAAAAVIRKFTDAGGRRSWLPGGSGNPRNRGPRSYVTPRSANTERPLGSEE